MAASNNSIFIGLPNSGKSSFIGALWHVIESGEIETQFSIKAQPEDREYLNRLRGSFLACEPVERTKTDFTKKIKLEICDKVSGRNHAFVFPDLSGETFVSHFESRKLSLAYISEVEQSDSLMLFVNPDSLKRAHLISHAGAMIGQDASNIEIDEDYIPWTPSLCQSQVILVDNLQMIQNRIRAPFKINIIISAWDVIKNQPGEDSKLSPRQWFIENLPLLHQFIESNDQLFVAKIYGISAQGGAYSGDAKSIEKLQKLSRQSERILVEDEGKFYNDITLPLKWFFE